MKKIWLSIVILILAVIVAGVGGCQPANAEQRMLPSLPTFAGINGIGENLGVVWSQQDTGLWVNGEGQVTAVSDVAILRLGVEAQQSSVAAAQLEAAEAMDKIMKTLKGRGIDERDIQTQRFSIYPVRRWVDRENREELIGYRVTNMVVVKISKVNEAGAIIDAVAEAGGNTSRIDSISFTVDDPTLYYEEARKRAVEDAMRKARQIAEAAGIGLGKPIYISEGVAYVPQSRDFYKGEAAAAPSVTAISPGELEFKITIQIVYTID